MNTQTIELDLSKEGLGTNLLRVGQGDKGGTTIKALVYDGGGEVTLSGFMAYLEVLLPDRASYYRAAATVSGNAATVTVDESKLCQIAGYTDEAYFTFEKGNTRYSTERFAIEILRSATAGQKPAQSYDDAIDSLINRGSAAVNAANNAAQRVETAITNANSLAASMPASGDSVVALKQSNAVLATALAELQDKYVVIDETAFAPANRMTGIAGETLTLTKASMSGETATLK